MIDFGKISIEGLGKKKIKYEYDENDENVIFINPKEYISLGKGRQSVHPNGTKRYYSDPNFEDIVGVAGEVAFGKKYNLNPDRKLRPEGDKNIDFKVITSSGDIITIDVKTALNPQNLFVKKQNINSCSDILVLAKYINEKVIQFLGYSTKEIMKEQQIRIFSYELGYENYYLHNGKLKSMDGLSWLHDGVKQIIIDE